MSVRAGARGGRLVLVLLLGAWSAISYAEGAEQMFGSFVEDPLRTRPPVLASGSTLPGDQSPVPCPAADIGDRPLALAEAIDIALCTNPQVRGTWAMIKVQAGALGEAKAAYLPLITAGLSRTKDRTDFPGSGEPGVGVDGNAVNVGASWRLFDFGGRAANERAAADLLDAALASHDAALQKTLAAVIGAYFDAQTAGAAWEAKQRSEALARTTLETAQRRESRGAGALTDTLQAMTAVAKASLERSRAQGDYRKAISVLVYALGLPADTRLSLAADLADQRTDVGKELAEWLEEAETRHPAILSARAQLQAARERVAITKSEGLPSLDVTGNLYQNGRPNQGLPSTRTSEKVFALTLNIPLFDGFARTYKVRGAQAQVEQKEADLQDAANQVLTDVVKAHADAMSALGNLDSSRALQQAAQSASDSIQRKFDRGAADVLEILSTQAALSDANLERIRCLAEWRSARLRLLATAGGLGRWSVRTVANP